MPTITEKARDGRSQILDLGDVEVVMSIKTWAMVANIGLSTAKRLLARGEGPALVRLSPGRVGVTAGSHARWLAERTET